MPQLLLASGSPRRRELLAQIGVPFTTLSADIDETPLKDETPAAYVERLTAQAAQRTLVNQRAQQQSLHVTDFGTGAQPPHSSSGLPEEVDPAAAERARAQFAAPGQQLPSEHPLSRGLRQVMKKIESNLQDMGQQQKHRQSK